jgi:hypothetical protein
MHAQPLSSHGLPLKVADRSSLTKHAHSQALLVHDFRVRGQSILRLAS